MSDNPSNEDADRDDIAADLAKLVDRGVLLHYEYTDGQERGWVLVKNESDSYHFTGSEVSAYISGAEDSTEAHG